MGVSEKAVQGRPREFDEGEALDAMMGVFWRNGYEGTSLSDLVEATGLLRGSLYAAFGSKAGMYTRALDRYHTQMVVVGADALDASTDPEAALRGFMSAPLGDRSGKGCFLCNASADRADADPGTADRVARSFARLETALRGLVGRHRPDWPELRIADRASLLLTTYSGLRIMSRAAATDPATLRRAVDAALDF